jgi:hypothetical protein
MMWDFDMPVFFPNSLGHTGRLMVTLSMCVIGISTSSVCVRAAERQKPPGISVVKAKKPLTVVLSHFKIAGPKDAIRLNWDHLKIPNITKRSEFKPHHVKHLPQSALALNGKRVRISGFMLPSFKPKGLKFFRFVKRNDTMTFPGTIPPTRKFPVWLRPGVTSDYLLNRRFDVVGTFKVAPLFYEGEVIALYKIVNALILPLKKPAKGQTLQQRTLPRPR